MSLAVLAAMVAIGLALPLRAQSVGVTTPTPPTSPTPTPPTSTTRTSSHETTRQRPVETFPVQKRRVWRFDESGCSVFIDNEFSGARVNACERVGPFEYRIITSPENLPINPSPWYAFRVRCDLADASTEPQESVEREITLRIVITSSKSRPWPCVSIDGGPFERAPRDRSKEGDGANECVLHLPLGDRPIIVAAHDMIGIGEIEGWTDGVAAQLGVKPREIGRSRGGREIRALEFGAQDASHRIVIIGRQHPPEVAGTMGLMRFVETLAANSQLGREFRARFRVLCVPLVNPDGVHEGNWRSTLGHVDANRDWHEFTQPETRAVRDAIQLFANEGGARVLLSLDFHATNKDIFYIPPDESSRATSLQPPHFARDWLAAIAARFPDYAVESSATNNLNEWTFKRWACETFAAPGITYELGTTTPPEKIGVIVPGAAEEAMRLLLRSVEQETRGSEGRTAQPAREPLAR